MPDGLGVPLVGVGVEGVGGVGGGGGGTGAGVMMYPFCPASTAVSVDVLMLNVTAPAAPLFARLLVQAIAAAFAAVRIPVGPMVTVRTELSIP